MYRTGGGPSNAPDFTPVEEKVLSICSNIKGLEARHDSDTITIPLTNETVHILEDTQDSELQNEGTSTIQDPFDLPDLNKSLIFQVHEEDNKSQKENKWNKWQPSTLKTRVSNVLKQESACKSSVTTKLDKLSSARLELVQLQIETAIKQQQFMEEEHNMKMLQLSNDERRKDELHKLLLKKINCAPDENNVLNLH